MINNELRVGRFTSSNNHRAVASLKNGNPSQAFSTYVIEKAGERMMGRSAEVKVAVRPMLWGKLMEILLFNLLGLEYKMEHKKTLVHPKYDFWSGTPDLETNVKAGEIKCPQPKKFAELSMDLLSKDIARIRKNAKEAYWQVVSNACILGVKKAEIITYMPYKSELKEIMDLVQGENFLERNHLNPEDYVDWFHEDNIENLPYLPDNSKMSNINSFEFELLEEDVEFLTRRLIMANEEAELILSSNGQA